MEYLLKSSGLIALLFVFYFIFLKNETFFKSIRWYFLIGLAVALLFPLIEIPKYVELHENVFLPDNFNVIESNSIQKNEVFTFSNILKITYFSGVITLTAKFIIQLFSLTFLLIKHPSKKINNSYLIETTQNISPFSFLNFIVYNKNDFSDEEMNDIINHEKVHVNQWHSIDTILTHLTSIIFWFNPFIWLYKKASQQNLEFIADAVAIEKSGNTKKYQLTLLKTCNANFCTQITSNFYNSLIKKRIVMLHKNKSKNRNQWKLLGIIPLIAIFTFIFNTKVIAQEKPNKIISEDKIELLIDKNTSDETLKQESNLFKEKHNIELTFKGIKRNSKNEIIAIQIFAEGKNMNANFSTLNTSPIQPVYLSYIPEKNSIQIGNITTRKRVINDEKIVIRDDNKPIYIVDKEINTEDEIENIDLDNIETIEVYKGDEAIKRYGEKGKNGIIFISTKKDELKDVLYILDGKEVSKEKIDELEPNDIEKIEVFKGDDTLEKFGEKAKNGVVKITSKKN